MEGIQNNCEEKEWEEIGEMENFDQVTHLRIREGVKKVLDCIKEHKRETYDDVITRLLTEHGIHFKDIPEKILKELDERIDEINKGNVYSSDEAKRRVFSNDESIL